MNAAKRIEHIVEELAHLLPAQGPIGVFIHHNTLHAFEHLPFAEAVREAAKTYGAEPYLSEEVFRGHLKRQRITAADVETVLAEEPNADIAPSVGTRYQLRRAMLLSGDIPMNPDEIDWWLTETKPDISRRRLFEICRNRTEEHSPKRVAAESSFVDPILIRLCAAYIDQGVSHWPMANRELGFLEAVRRIFAQGQWVEPFPGVEQEFARQTLREWSAAQTVAAELSRLSVEHGQEEQFLRRELLALAGWAGIFHVLEKAPELAPYEKVPCRLMDYLAVRLTLRAGAEPTNGRPAAWVTPAGHLTAAALFAAAEALSLSAADLQNLRPAELQRLCEEVMAFDDIERRRIWQAAYERHHERQVLGALQGRTGNSAKKQRALAQIFFCIDEREESLRRHLEEMEPRIETFGAAGFFGVAIDYAGIDDGRSVSLCPVVVKPQHAVREKPLKADEAKLELRAARRRLRARLAESAMRSSQKLWLGWVSTALLGVFSLFPLFGRVLAPLEFAKLRNRLNSLFFPEPRTELTLMYEDEKAFHVHEDLQLGFQPNEKADRVESVLGPAGLRNNHARLVLFLGHGSTTMNNPLESAYNCGACGGRRGGPNARLFAAMANRPGVRELLRERGIDIPNDTWFVGGYHDTASDGIELFDTDQLPAEHRAELAALQTTLDRARAANALERCRRFASAQSVSQPESGLRHVEQRSEHLGEPRPELGHCTNAVAVVGRRDLTRGLFLDRRWFLVSYDPLTDVNSGNLARLLTAGVPVCAGISLEYYFSSVDPQRYGCGTKLPHNVTSLLGIMDGHASDLRTGLCRQMTEIHEPVRILFVVETTPEKLLKVVEALPGVLQLVVNEWVRVATVDPDSGAIHVFRKGQFVPYTERLELPAVQASRDWYSGEMDHLGVATVGGPV